MTFRWMIVLCLCLLAVPLLASAQTNTSMARIVVPSRDVARGETITKSDLTYRSVPASALSMGIVTTMADLEGMQARRFLRAGEAVRDSDVRHPVVVTRGSTVTMVFEAPGLSLTAIGRAMGDGGVGDAVTILNPVSYRKIAATVTGPGTVRAEASLPGARRMAPMMAAANAR